MGQWQYFIELLFNILIIITQTLIRRTSFLYVYFFFFLAQLNSVRGMLETLAPIIIYPLYNQLYKLTFETLPGAFFLLTAVITVPVVILFG